MYPFFGKIKRLRRISFFLFLTPTLALILSLLFNNLLMNFNFHAGSYGIDTKKLKYPIEINCAKNNNYCKLTNLQIDEDNYKNCFIFKYYHYFTVNNTKFTRSDFTKKYNYDQNLLNNLNVKFIIEKNKSNEIEKNCLLNNNLYLKVYDHFPKLFHLIIDIKRSKKYNPGTSVAVYPFMYGEASISNIVKRFPINILFKPLLYITSLLMVLYWINYNKIFNEILGTKKINKFTILGVFSSLFLFFHVFFLGTSIESDLFEKIRKLILLLFIICEILAQFFLTRRLYISMDSLINYTYAFVIKLKIIFTSIVIFTTVIVLIILSIYNLHSKIGYILEWNYFLLLLLFYLLSWAVWKKQ